VPVMGGVGASATSTSELVSGSKNSREILSGVAVRPFQDPVHHAEID
jgi:hypothetical protein